MIEIKKNVVNVMNAWIISEESPLVCVEDHDGCKDSSDMNFDETVAYILNLVQDNQS